MSSSEPETRDFEIFHNHQSDSQHTLEIHDNAQQLTNAIDQLGPALHVLGIERGFDEIRQGNDIVRITARRHELRSFLCGKGRFFQPSIQRILITRRAGGPQGNHVLAIHYRWTFGSP